MQPSTWGGSYGYYRRKKCAGRKSCAYLINDLLHVLFLLWVNGWISVAGIMHKDTIHSAKEITALSCRPKYPSRSEIRKSRKNKMIDRIRFRLRTVSDSGLFACGIGANRIIGMAEIKSPHKRIIPFSTTVCMFSSSKNRIYAPIVPIWHRKCVLAW